MSFLSHITVQSVVESFLGNFPFDLRFTSSDLHSFPTTHAIVVDPISFKLPALKAGSIYRMNQAVLSMSVEITTKKGVKPPDNAKVALANNSVNALFSSSQLSLNGVGKSFFKLKDLPRVDIC